MSFPLPYCTCSFFRESTYVSLYKPREANQGPWKRQLRRPERHQSSTVAPTQQHWRHGPRLSTQHRVEPSATRFKTTLACTRSVGAVVCSADAVNGILYSERPREQIVRTLPPSCSRLIRAPALASTIPPRMCSIAPGKWCNSAQVMEASNTIHTRWAEAGSPRPCPSRAYVQPSSPCLLLLLFSMGQFGTANLAFCVSLERERGAGLVQAPTKVSGPSMHSMCCRSQPPLLGQRSLRPYLLGLSVFLPLPKSSPRWMKASRGLSPCS